MKYLKLYEDMNQSSNLKNLFRLNQLGLSESGLNVLSVSIHWESLDGFVDSKHKDHYVVNDPLFTFYEYSNWPTDKESGVWQEKIDDIWHDWREWFGQEGDSDEIFDHLIEEAQAGRYDLLHLRNEGQFYDPWTREMVGTGSMKNPKLNESANSDRLIPSTEEAIAKFSNWKRLAKLGLAERMALVQIETQSDWMDLNLGFLAQIDADKFREFKEFVKRFGVVHTNSYAGRSKDDQTISANLWEMPQWSMWAFSKLPELAKSGFAPIKSYKDPNDRIWNSWYSAIAGTERVNESNSFTQKLRLFKLGLMTADQFDVHKVSVVADCPPTESTWVRSRVISKIQEMYVDLKPRAAELGVQLIDFEKYSLDSLGYPTQAQFYCIGPIESIEIIVAEIKKAFNQIIPKNSKFRSIIFGADAKSMSHSKLEPTTEVFKKYAKWLSDRFI